MNGRPVVRATVGALRGELVSAVLSALEEGLQLDQVRATLLEVTSGLPVLATLANQGPQGPKDVPEIIALVERHFRLPTGVIVGHSNAGNVARARAVAYALARTVIGGSYIQLARLFGRNHTSVLSGVQRVERDKALAAELAKLIHRCRGRTASDVGEPTQLEASALASISARDGRSW